MSVSRFGNWFALCACALASCSSADPATQRQSTSGGLPPQATFDAGSGTPTGVAGGGFGNSNTPAQQAPTVMQPQMTKPPPVAGGVQPVSIDACGAGNPAGLSDADAQKLMAGGSGAGSMRWLYPYDGTVFPRGMLPPTLMWEGADAAQAIYLHIKATRFEYKGCLKPDAAGQLTIAADVWTSAGLQTMGGADPFSVELSALSGGSVSGPIKLSWIIAQATIKGSIYYNSYTSQLAASSGGGGPGFGGGSGAVLRIQKGKTAEVFENSQGCTACHTVSASGNTVIALVLGAGGGLLNGTGSSYPVTPMSAPNPAPIASNLANAAFPAVSPDGTLFVTNAHQNGVGARAGGPGAIGDPDAKVFDSATGNEVTNAGVPAGAMTPMFSPDAALLAFTDYAISDGHGMAVMDFDMSGKKASGYRKVFTESDTTKYPAWPFFLPDQKALVFAIGTAADFSGMGVGLAGGAIGADVPDSDLHILDLASAQSTMLAQAMGFATAADAASNHTYLPFAAEELHHNYYPTVAPVPAGGYYWVFFDSYRHYGNQGLQRQLWGTAVDVSADGTYTRDPSHPAFYLTGQEPNTGNHRAFAALDPCMKEGDTCTSGTDCCGGFCYVDKPMSEFMSEPVGSCTMHTPMCSKLNDRCTSSSDCCPPDAGQQPYICIGGYCAQVAPVR